MTGQTISHYKILEKLGEGGMGVVYKATDTKLERTVALKFLASDRLENEEHKARFRREARAAAALDHPNICTVYEIDEADGQTFLAMPYLEGLTVRQKVKQRPLKLDRSPGHRRPGRRRLASRACEGHCSPRHQERQPDGLAARPGQDHGFRLGPSGRPIPADEDRDAAGHAGVHVARAGPKRLPTDRRTDIWSLGIVIYEMLIGRTPFEGEREQAVLYRIVQEEPEPITSQRARVPLDLDWIVSKALAKDADERYQHIDEMLVDLARRRAAGCGRERHR